jgi:N-methylhydantoinase B
VATGTKEAVAIEPEASDELRARLRGERPGQEPFFDRGPGYARLAGGQAAAAVDWLPPA